MAALPCLLILSNVLLLGLPLHTLMVLGMRCQHVESSLFFREILEDELILMVKMEAYFDPVCNPWWLSGKDSTRQCRRCGFDSCVEKIPWRSKWPFTPVFLPRKSCGQRNLVGYSPWGRKRVRRNLTTMPLSPLLCSLKCGLLISGPGITWELVRNAKSGAHPTPNLEIQNLHC